MTTEAPRLSEADATGRIPVKYLTRLLVEEKNDILIVDDHDQYNMTLVLAAMRGSFKGIWTSRHDNLQVVPRQRLLDNIEPTLWNAQHPGFNHHTPSCTICSSGRSFQWASKLRDELHDTLVRAESWKKHDLGFMAHELSDKCSPSVPKGLIWLSFPWFRYPSGVATYIRKFLFDCSEEQKIGDVVLISLMGPNPHNTFDEYYQMERLIPFSVRLGYAHFVEPTFVKVNCVHYGFRHRTYKRKYNGDTETDMHWVATPFSQVHVFIKVKAADDNVRLSEIGPHLEVDPPRQKKEVEWDTETELDSEPDSAPALAPTVPQARLPSPPPPLCTPPRTPPRAELQMLPTPPPTIKRQISESFEPPQSPTKRARYCC